MKELIKKWWFWVIIIVLIVMLYIVGVATIQSKVKKELSNTTEFNKEIRNNIEKRKQAWEN